VISTEKPTADFTIPTYIGIQQEIMPVWIMVIEVCQLNHLNVQMNEFVQTSAVSSDQLYSNRTCTMVLEQIKGFCHGITKIHTLCW